MSGIQLVLSEIVTMHPLKELYVSTVEIAQIKASGMGPTTGSKVEFKLPDCQRNETLEGIEIVGDHSNASSSLVTKLGSAILNKVRIRMLVESTRSNNCCILMFDTGDKYNVKFAVTKEQCDLPGPTVVIRGEDIHIFDGKEMKVIKGIVKAGDRLDLLLVDSAMTLLSPLKRSGVRLVIPPSKEFTLTAYFNTTLDTLNQNGITVQNCSSQSNFKLNSRL